MWIRLGLRELLPQQYEVTSYWAASFPGLVWPVLGALKLPGKALIVLGQAESVLGTP
jgi:hypothetical protein